MISERTTLAVVLLCLVPLGYWLRFRAPLAPELRDSSGGVVYVVLWVVSAAFFWVRTAASRLALGVLLVTCLLEFLQLWHPVWLEAIRATFPGRVLLGTTFGWDDFPPYFLGAFLGWFMVKVIRRRTRT